MPAGTIHECIAKKLENYIHVGSNDFYVGSVAPDSWRNSESTKEESHFYINNVSKPRYDVFYDKYKNHINNEYILGYFIHLIADYYWYSHNFTIVNDDRENFKKRLYALYTIYDLNDIEHIKEDFFNPVEELSSTGINKTIDFLNTRPEECDISKIDMSKIENEIDETVKFIKKEFKRYGIKKEYHIKFKNIFKHLHVVNRHRWNVFKLCCKAGIPWQGLMHDLSKYGITEFWESVKYFEGTYSPIVNAKRDKGYSDAWLHHKGRNKHHYEYWYDYQLPQAPVMMPLKYFKEMICDSYAAGIVYQGKNWKPEYQLTYWKKVGPRARIHPNLRKAMDETFEMVAEKGLDAVINPEILEKIYNKNNRG